MRVISVSMSNDVFCSNLPLFVLRLPGLTDSLFICLFIHGVICFVSYICTKLKKKIAGRLFFRERDSSLLISLYGQLQAVFKGEKGTSVLQLVLRHHYNTFLMKLS